MYTTPIIAVGFLNRGCQPLRNLQSKDIWQLGSELHKKTINSMGFSPWDMGFKFISLVTDSSAY